MKLAREIAGVARDVADAAHGWVLDPVTARVYPAAAFHDHVPGDHPDVRTLIMVHSIIGGNVQPSLDTAGLHRYGLPELYVSEAAAGQLDQTTDLMNAAAQVLIDGGDVDSRGELATDFHRLGWDVGLVAAGTGRAVWTTRWAREAGASDDADLVVELVPLDGAGTEGETKLIDDCFGHLPDPIAERDASDPELKAAAEKARADLTKLRSHFRNGMPVDEQLTIKARFTDDDGRVEWMWVAVVAFQGDWFEGTLDNGPEVITSLHDGQKVRVTLADVGDYILEKTGAKRRGGYSIEVFEKRGLVPPSK